MGSFATKRPRFDHAHHSLQWGPVAFSEAADLLFVHHLEFELLVLTFDLDLEVNIASFSMGDAVSADASSQGAGLLRNVVGIVRNRPYILLSIIVLTPPFWTLLFLFMPVIIAGVVLVAGFVIVDQASQKQASGESDEKSEQSAPASVPAHKGTEESTGVAPVGSGPARSERGADASLRSAAPQEEPVHATTTQPSVAVPVRESKQSVQALQPDADLDVSAPKAVAEKGPVSAKSASAPMTGPAMLARAAALRKSKLEAASKSSGEVVFLYGSQTGNAMEVAKSLNAEVSFQAFCSEI